MEHALFYLTLSAAIFIMLFGVDDLFIDTVAIMAALGPIDLSQTEVELIRRGRQKRLAIIIANWREDEILGAMIRGNLGRIDYQNFVFFLGVYPNDEATVSVARDLEKRFPGKVVTVVNRRPGPTSKGQMLNEIVDRVLHAPKDDAFELLLMQDSEDILHPLSLSLLSHFADEADFIQLPVFSFDLPKRALIGSVYIDEFGEPHTKDLLVRNYLGAAIPSAGVGTMISSQLARHLWQTTGTFLREDSLTEDYLLGLSIKPLGFRQRFLCVRTQLQLGERAGDWELIATREYFPATVMASVRQKTRWTLGIVFQGGKFLHWQGDWIDRYFLMRDRRGPLNSVLTVGCVFISAALIGFRLHTGHYPENFSAPWFQVLISCNLGLMVWRIGQRMRAVHKTHSLSQSLMVPVRWIFGAFINVAAAARAYWQFRASENAGRALTWAKTTHQLPKNFGAEPLFVSEPLQEGGV